MLSKKGLTVAAIAAAATACPYTAMAAMHYNFAGGGSADARLTLSYGAQMRMKNPDSKLAESSDGDSNFRKNDLTSNNVQALLQAGVRKGVSGFVLSATYFYDDVYFRSPHNDSPLRSTPGPTDRFPDHTRYFSGSYGRILDAYGYTSIDTGGGTLLTLKLGNQVVNWGQMNFFPDMALAQGPVDAVKGKMPGAQTQAILLPERQLSLSFAVNSKLTLLANYQFGFHRTLLPGVGSYFSSSNISGPSGSCLGVYVSGACTGVNLLTGAPGPGATYAGRNDVSDFGQYGVGGRYQLTRATELGFFYLHFNDRTTLPRIDAVKNVFTYQNMIDEDLVGVTTSTLLAGLPRWMGSIRMATETTYRWKGTVLKGGLGTPSYGHVVTSGVDLLNNLGHTFLSPLTTLLFEVSGHYISGVGPTSALTYGTRTAGAAHVNLVLDYPGIIPGWELAVPINYAYQFNGRALYGPTVGGEHAGVYSIAANATWHQNLQFGLSYQGYTGGVDTRAESAHPMADRDFMAFTVTYTF